MLLATKATDYLSAACCDVFCSFAAVHYGFYKPYVTIRVSYFLTLNLPYEKMAH